MCRPDELHNSSLAAYVKSGAMIRNLLVTRGVITFCCNALCTLFFCYQRKTKSFYLLPPSSTVLNISHQERVSQQWFNLHSNEKEETMRFLCCFPSFFQSEEIHTARGHNLLNFNRVVCDTSATTSKPALSCFSNTRLCF